MGRRKREFQAQGRAYVKAQRSERKGVLLGDMSDGSS